MVKNFMTASQARTMTEASDKLISVVFKSIKSAAEYGNNQISFGVYEADDSVITRLIKTLTEADYLIEPIIEGVDGIDKTVGLKITW